MQDKNPSSTNKAIAAAIIGQSIWGLSFMASRVALDIAPVLILLSHRFLAAFVVMTVLCFTPIGSIHLRGKRLLPLLLLGICEPVVYFIGEQYGILHSSTIFSGVMIALIPIASTLTAISVLGEKPTVLQMLYSLLSVGGVIGIGLLTKNSGSLDLIGIMGLLVAVFAAVVYNLLSRGISKQYTPFERTYAMLSVGAVVFTVMAMTSVHGDTAAYLQPLSQGRYLLALIFLSAGCSVISFFLSSYALTKLTIARSTVFANLTTAISIFAGVVFLHEPFSIVGLFCCGAILIGIYGVQHAAQEEGKKP